MPSSLFGPRAQPNVQPQQSATTNFQLPQNVNQIKSLWNMLNSGSITQVMAQTMLERIPQVKPIMELVGKYNGDAKSAFYDLAKQKNVDPNQIIDILK